MSEQLVAITPSELPVVQQDLAHWCLQKIVGLGKDLRQARQNLSIAREAGWQRSNWVREISKVRDRMIYYAKIKAAVQAGYLIIPNFDIDVFVCRVNRENPPRKSASYESYEVAHAQPALLPAGSGRYVGQKLETDYESWKESDPANPGKAINKERYTSIGYTEDIDFPIRIIKPQVLAATQRAMALRLFDRIGIVKHQARADPIVLGQIIDPAGRDRLFHPKVVSFFVAWWMNPEDL